MQTSLGAITLELDGDKAPLSVSHFLALVNRRHYDGTILHRVEQGFIALGGGFSQKLEPRPVATTVRNEAEQGLKNARGTIALSRDPAAIDSAGGEFFFNLADNPTLDHRGDSPEEYGYCAFGRVTSGLEVLEKIGRLAVKNEGEFENLPVETVLIQSIERLK
jgi:peptidyl-prolyl cis-trans isomerase B (cyclophilin B)